MQLNLNIFDFPSDYEKYLLKKSQTNESKETSFEIYFYVDILRATSTILTMLDSGVNSIEVFKNKELAKLRLININQNKTKQNNTEKILLCGEENSLKPEDFFGGNSPLEYLNNTNLKNSSILFTSTNGAKIIANDKNQGNYFDFLDKDNSERYILSFLNFTLMILKINTIILEKISSNKYKEININLVCGGENNQFSIEDAMCAMYFFNMLQLSLFEIADLQIHLNISLDIEEMIDNLEIFLTNGFDDIGDISKYNTNIFDFIRKYSTHIQRLKELNCEKDIDFCLQFDKVPIIAKVIGNKILKI